MIPSKDNITSPRPRRGMRVADAKKACPGIALIHVETISEGTEEGGPSAGL